MCAEGELLAAHFANTKQHVEVLLSIVNNTSETPSNILAKNESIKCILHKMAINSILLIR